MTGLTFSEGGPYLVLIVIGVSTCDLVHDVETFSASVSCDDSGVGKPPFAVFLVSLIKISKSYQSSQHRKVTFATLCTSSHIAASLKPKTNN